LLMLLCCGPGVTITNSSLDAKKMMMLFTNIAEFPNIREFRLPDLAQTLDTTLITFAILELQPWFK
jgi:hypothetical protein